MKSTDFLKNKTVLITGGTGSFGRNFVECGDRSHSVYLLMALLNNGHYKIARGIWLACLDICGMNPPIEQPIKF